eukprot:scaffold49346_cov16-Prasinocladus_malaysianus.AAC.3
MRIGLRYQAGAVENLRPASPESLPSTQAHIHRPAAKHEKTACRKLSTRQPAIYSTPEGIHVAILK